MNYKIGQVIYILSKDTNTVLPVVVREEIYHRSIDGESVNYRLGIGPSGNQKIVDLTSIKGEAFGSLDEVKEHLLKQQTAVIDNVCYEAAQRVSAWYGGVTQRQPVADKEQQPTGFSPDQLLNQVDGPKAIPASKVSIPEHLPGVTGPVPQSKEGARKQLRESLKKNMMDPEDVQGNR